MDIAKELWEVSSRLSAIAKLLQNQQVDLEYSDDTFHGLGEILNDLVERIRKMQDQAEK